MRREHATFMEECEARNGCGDSLVIASLGASVKDGSGDTVKILLLFDRTGVPLKGKTRVRDQDRTSCAPGIKRVLREIVGNRGWPFGFKAGASDAHRTIPIAGADWPRLGCRSRGGGPIYIHTCGTFSVASATHWRGV